MSLGEGELDKPAILVVDDELGYREGIRRILEARGFCAQAAASGFEALKLLAEREIAVMLVDLKMPGMDGVELMRRVRQAHPQTLCVVISAFGTIESAVQSTKLGAFDFVVKPFSPDELVAVVKRAAEQWALSKEALRLRAEREAHLMELAAEKSRLRTIVQSMADGLLVVNRDGDVVLDNPAARRLLDHVELPAMRGPVAMYLRDEQLLTEMGSIIDGRGGQEAAILETELNERAEPRTLRVTMTPVVDDHHAILGVVVALSDITQAKSYERMRSQFVSMVAHELKAPIGVVQGYLGLLAAGTLDSDESRRKKIVGRCMERTGALLALIQDLLEMTRRQSQPQTRRLEPVDVVAATRSLLEFHRAQADARGLSLQLQAEPLQLVSLDPADWERLLTNLLSNAIKYNRRGGWVHLFLSRRDNLLCLEVADSGIGMTDEERSHLGQEFFRAKNPQTRSIPGTGLGITLVQRIVDSYHGALQVESTPDQGTTFRVLLPFEPPSRSPGHNGGNHGSSAS